MKMKVYLVVTFVLACSFGLMACTKESKEQDDKVSVERLYEANFDCIGIESHDVNMYSDTKGTAKLTVKLPDYEILYKDAYESKNPDEYLLNLFGSNSPQLAA